jgi:hypothetical protein
LILALSTHCISLILLKVNKGKKGEMRGKEKRRGGGRGRRERGERGGEEGEVMFCTSYHSVIGR